MARAYTADLPRPAGIPAHLEVRVFVMRADEKPLSAEDLEALARVYPPPAETRAAIEASIARARVRAKTSPAKRAKASPAKRTSPKTSVPKRKAAKKPTRAR